MRPHIHTDTPTCILTVSFRSAPAFLSVISCFFFLSFFFIRLYWFIVLSQVLPYCTVTQSCIYTHSSSHVICHYGPSQELLSFFNLIHHPDSEMERGTPSLTSRFLAVKRQIHGAVWHPAWQPTFLGPKLAVFSCVTRGQLLPSLGLSVCVLDSRTLMCRAAPRVVLLAQRVKIGKRRPRPCMWLAPSCLEHRRRALGAGPSSVLSPICCCVTSTHLYQRGPRVRLCRPLPCPWPLGRLPLGPVLTLNTDARISPGPTRGVSEVHLPSLGFSLDSQTHGVTSLLSCLLPPIQQHTVRLLPRALGHLPLKSKSPLRPGRMHRTRCSLSVAAKPFRIRLWPIS